jgi:hypothetical protein
MRKIYVLFLLVSGVVFGQTNYRIKISKLNYTILKGVKNKTSSNIRITINYENGTSYNAYKRDIDNEGDNESNLDIPEIWSVLKPISIDCYAFVNFRTGTDANGTISKNVNTYCPNGIFDGDYSPRMTHITFNYSVEPKLDVFAPVGDDALPTDDFIDIKSASGFSSNYYNWQYAIESSSGFLVWVDLPQYYGKSTITTNATEILGANAGSFHGKKISFRLRPCGLKTYNLGNYKIRLTAPKIVSTPVPTMVSCYDKESADGTLKLEFNRKLLPSEILDLDLLPESNGDRYGIIISDEKTYIINGLARGDYELRFLGFMNGSPTFSSTSSNPIKFSIGSPTPVDFSLTKTDVRCNGGQDGTITISASGGTGKGYEYSIENGSWVPFLNKESTTETITGLYPLLSTDLDITYNIRVRDANKCIAKIQKVLPNGSIELGLELLTPITITQPAAPLSLTNDPIFKKDPTFSGAENGTITASITGGTPKVNAALINGDSYTYAWSNANYKTEILAGKTTTQYNNGIFAIKLQDVKAGTYNLTVKDANGCTLDPISQPKLTIVLTEPDPIKIELSITTPISCNTDNFDPDTGDPLKLADGIITASVTGGVPFTGAENRGLSYIYIWSKYNVVKDEWAILNDVKGPVATGLSMGSYSLNVKDKNGISQGTYNTIELTKAITTDLSIGEPDPLKLTFSPTAVSCYNGTNGSAIANVTGGTGGYFYDWDNNAKTQSITGLDANDGNKYWVTITDSKGCTTNGGIVITQPSSPISLEYTTVDNPKFSGATNGKLVVDVSGGTIKDDNSYGYLWKNSKGVTQIPVAVYNPETQIYTITLDNLPADDYSLTVWDKNYNAAKPAQIVNCSVIDSKIKLEQPKPLVVTLEIKQTISCNAKNPFGKEADSSPADGQRNESQDGILIAHVTGGTPFLTSENSGLPYIYEWKKLQPDNKWKDLSAVKDSIAVNLSHGNYALNIKDRNGIVLGSYDVNNALIVAKDTVQFMKEPAVFAVNITKGDVYCNGGNDGWATANAVGGTTSYQYNWSDGEVVAENEILKAGDYSVIVNDNKQCVAKDKVTILEPTAPISLNYTTVLNPSFYKATNGKIVVEVKGGTPFVDKSYGYEWKNRAGVIQTAASQIINGVYTLTLNGLPEDIYFLTIKDANYEQADSRMGCTLINSAQTLEDPDPLEVIFEVQRTISCNVSNEFGNEIDTTPKDGLRDESQDGILVAHVSGGIPLDANQNNGLPYFYTWKKQLANKSWVIWNDHDETAEYLSNGTYALNVEDKNGIKLGTYVNNILTKEIDVTQPMPEPAKLVLTFTKSDVGCTVGNDGWAKANVTGGTAPYTYQWTNEAITDKIENLTANNYFVMVTDAKGCSVQGSVFVGDPNGIIATETTKNPTCFQGNDGFINLDVKGGNLPYTYKWNTGVTTKDVSQLKAGNYEVTITCPDCCVYKKYFTLKDPAPIVVNLGSDRTLCSGQSLDAEATILDANAQYSWTATNGFTANTPKVNLTKAGIYNVKVTSGLGCIGEDEIEIKTNNGAINSEFLLSSQAYLDEEVILVNTSNPFGENTQWIIPENVSVIEQKERFITLKFNKTGVYAITLKQTQGDCYALYSKNISVETRSSIPTDATANAQFINDFIVTPNPNDGNFNALINLENSSPINLRLFSYNGQYTLIQKKDSGKKNYAVDFNVKLASGMYVLVLETAQQTLVKKIIIY